MPIKINGKILAPRKEVEIDGFIVYNCPAYSEVRISNNRGEVIASILYPELARKGFDKIRFYGGSVNNISKLLRLTKLIKKIYDSLYR